MEFGKKRKRREREFDKAIEEILQTRKEFLEKNECEYVDEDIAHARAVLDRAPHDLREALVLLAGNWSRDDMLLLDSIIDYIDVLTNVLKTQARS